MAKTLFVIKGVGNDGNSGATWALAKRTVAAAIAAVDAGGGNTIYVASDRTENTETIVNPPSVGVSGSPNRIIADPYGTVQDGGGNYHGQTPGFVYLVGASGLSAIAFGNAVADFWEIRGFVIAPYLFRPSSTTVTVSIGYSRGFKLADCIVFGNNTGLMNFFASDSATPATDANYFSKCLFICAAAGINWSQSTAGGAFISGMINVYDCVIIGGRTFPANNIIAANSTSKCEVSFFDTLVVSPGIRDTTNNNLNSFIACGNFHTANAKYNATRCQVIGGGPSPYSPNLTVTDGTISGCISYGNNGITSGWTAVKQIPYVLVPACGLTLPLNDILSSFSANPDIMGNTRTAGKTPGASEYVDAFTKLVKPPEFGGTPEVINHPVRP